MALTLWQACVEHDLHAFFHLNLTEALQEVPYEGEEGMEGDPRNFSLRTPVA